MTAHTIAAIVPMVDLNPLKWLGDKAKENLAEGFTSMMMGLWSAGMWLVQLAYEILDNFTTPNVEDPDLVKLYSVTLWISLLIALVIAFGQIGLAVLRQDGRGFGTLAAGVVQYGLVVAGWIAVCAGLIAGTAELTKGILSTLLDVDSFSGYAAGDGFVDTVSGTVQASVLGVCALFILLPAAFVSMAIELVRAAALLLLTATMPIAAAGALSEGTKSWMWKSVRWFLTCTLMAPMLALALGLGTQFAWAGLPDGEAAEGSSSAANIGMSVVGSIILLVAAFTPLVLFRVMAFVDPGTASGASFRSTIAANGGMAGLLRGKSAQAVTGEAPGSGAASETASDGRTTSENGAEAETAGRFQGSKLAKVGRTVGGIAAAGMTKTGQVAQVGTSMGVDVLGHSGIGNQGYYDTGHTPGTRAARPRRRPIEDHNGDGVANDIPPPVRYETVEEGADVR